jgi:hypothetical protein
MGKWKMEKKSPRRQCSASKNLIIQQLIQHKAPSKKLTVKIQDKIYSP